MMATNIRGATGSAGPGGGAALPPPDRFSVLGVDFTLSTDSVQVRDFFRAAYRRFVASGEGPATLSLSAVMAPAAGGPYAAVDGVVLDLSGRPMPENRAFLHLLNALMDRISGFIVVHAAAVSVGGRGILIAGPSSAGKSTLVLELCRKGATFLSDDVAPIDRGTGLLHAFPRAIGIRRDAGADLGFDPARVPAGMLHTLPHKWIVDPAALGLPLPGDQDAPFPIEAVVFLEVTDGAGTVDAGPRQRRRLDLAMVEEDQALLDRLRGIGGVSDIRVAADGAFPVVSFLADRAARPMHALADLCRERRDVILYLDEARPATPARPEKPVLTEARWSSLLMDLTRDLLNRSETGALMASLGGLPALVTELGSLLRGARAYRLRPGSPGETADLILALSAGDGGMGTIRQ